GGAAEVLVAVAEIVGRVVEAEDDVVDLAVLVGDADRGDGGAEVHDLDGHRAVLERVLGHLLSSRRLAERLLSEQRRSEEKSGESEKRSHGRASGKWLLAISYWLLAEQTGDLPRLRANG